MSAEFPSKVWSGAGVSQNAGDGPNNSEWDQIVAEVQATQQRVLDHSIALGGGYALIYTNSTQSTIGLSTSPADIDGWDAAEDDGNVLFFADEGDGEITINKAGIYLIGYSLSFSLNSTSIVTFDLIEATLGTLDTHRAVIETATGDIHQCSVPLTPITVTAGQVFQIQGSVDSGTPNFTQVAGQFIAMPKP
jgi:hypothetical protein